MENKKIKTDFGFSVNKEKLSIVKDYIEEFETLYDDSKVAYDEQDEKSMNYIENDYERLVEALNREFADEIEEAGGYDVPSLYWKN